MRFARVLTIAAAAAISAFACFELPNMHVLEFVRPGHYYVDNAARSRLYEFLKDKIDITEDSTGLLASLWKSLNPSIRTFRYALDMQLCQHSACGYGTGNAPPHPDEAGLPESYFLHYAETTQVRLRPIYGRPADFGAPDPWIVTIPGCPVGTPATRACRLQSWGWNDTAFFYDQGNPQFRAWMARRLVEIADAHDADGIFLDAHGPTFRSIYLASTDVISGGTVREYGVRANDAAIDDRYASHLLMALEEEREALRARNKFLLVNCAAWSLDPKCMAQAFAAGGVHTEMLFTTTMSATQIDQMIDLIESISRDRNGIVDLYGSACWWGGPHFTSAGNFSSPRARYLYWRFAAYLLVREQATTRGHAYFDPTFCFSDVWGTQPDFDPTRPGAYDDYRSEWLGAFRELGTPLEPAYRVAEGTSPPGTCDQSWGRRYTVFRREYSDGIVLVRPRDHWDCNGYGNGSAVTVSLGGTYRMRREDGTLGAPITAVTLRNSEAIILERP